MPSLACFLQLEPYHLLAVVAICSANIVVVAHCKLSALPLLFTYIFDLVPFFLPPPCPGYVLVLPPRRQHPPLLL